MEQKKSIWIKLLYFIAIFLLLTWTFSIFLYADEAFTLGLIKHNWLEIIKLDSMDVHPPLYYLVLKLFLTLTTFWTSSMVIKAIFARIFSIICFTIMSKGIQIIFKKVLNKNINFSIIFLGLLLLPNILYHATCIRMYAFGAMLITWELVCLINYRQKNKTLYLIYALILAEIAAYTHYFAAIIGGLLLMYEFFSVIKNKQFHSAIKIGTCGITLPLLFLPWLIVALKQISNVSQNFWMPYNLFNFVDIFYHHAFPIHGLFYISFILLIILTIFCYIKGSTNFKYIYRRVLFSFYGAMLIGIAISFLTRPMFQSRYLFFIFPLYLCLTIYELLIVLNKKKYLKNIIIFIIIFFSLGIFRNIAKGAYCIIRNFNTYQQVENFSKQNNKNVYLTSNDLNAPLDFSLYLPNKSILINYNKKNICFIETGNKTNNQFLFNKIFPNIKSTHKK